MSKKHYSDKTQSYVGLIAVLVIGMAFVLSNTFLKANNSYWKCVLGEAAQCGYSEMKAVALVYRNRTDLNMNMGCTALARKDLKQFIAKETNEKKAMVRKVIKEVFVDRCEDITNGATHYENVAKYGEPWWAQNMIITLKKPYHTFYKER